jgi:hypothetical protein
MGYNREGDMVVEVVQGPYISNAIDRIRSDFNDLVSINKDAQIVYNFGRNRTAGKIRQTIWSTGGNATHRCAF